MHIRLEHASSSSKLVGTRQKEGDGDAIDTGFLAVTQLIQVRWHLFVAVKISIESECNFFLFVRVKYFLLIWF